MEMLKTPCYLDGPERLKPEQFEIGLKFVRYWYEDTDKIVSGLRAYEVIELFENFVVVKYYSEWHKKWIEGQYYKPDLGIEPYIDDEEEKWWNPVFCVKEVGEDGNS